jgi:hypothetical protein
VWEQVIRVLAAGLLAITLLLSPAYAQRPRPGGPAPPTEPRKPIVEYIVVVVLLGVSLGLVCRSSRR